MSFDPSYPPDQPPPPGGEPGVPPPGGAYPGVPPGYGPATDPQATRSRAQLPAIFLIVAAVLNLLVALFLVFRLIQTAVTPADALHAAAKEQVQSTAKVFPGLAPMFDPVVQMKPDDYKRQSLLEFGIFAAVTVLAAILGLLGGVRMYQLRSFGLCVVGAVATAIPCVSPSACLCGLGSVVGVWALIVLLNPDVRSLFR